jgi:TRAP-type C4-dicarboxylate transport system permease small subunit
VVYLLEFVFIGFLILYGYFMAEMVWGQISPALGLRYTYVYASVPVGAALMAVHLLAHMRARYLTPRLSPRKV